MASSMPPVVESGALRSPEALEQQHHEQEVVPKPAPAPAAAYVPPPPRSRTAPAAPSKAEKTGPPMGVIGAAVAIAATAVIAVGVGVLKKSSGGKTGGKKPASKPAAATRTTSSRATPRTSTSSSRPSSRASAGGGASSRSAAPRTSSSSSTGGAAPAAAGSRRSSSTVGGSKAGAPRRSAGGSAAAAAAAAATTAAAAVAAAPAAAAQEAAPAAPAAAAAAASKPAAAAAPAAPAPAAAAPAADKEPAAPTTPAVAAEAAPEAPVRTPVKQQPAAAAAAAEDKPAAAQEQQQQQQQAGAPAPSAPAAAPPAAEAAPKASQAGAEGAAAADAPAADAAAAAADTAAAAADATPAAAPAAADAAAADADPTAAAAADAADAAPDAGGGGGDDDLIELAEGETLPVVDEAGNQLGVLHHDGRVLDEAGREIGGLDEEGNVVLYEQAGGAEDGMMVLSPTEEEAEQLMRQAAVAWNVHHNKEGAEKLQRRALEVVTKEKGAARPEVIAEVASSLADMMYATQKLGDAKEALQIALDAAEAGQQYPLYIKLTNNMGAVLRKQELHEEGKVLHRKALDLALAHFGVAHPTATLARGNLVDALDQLGEREAARVLLNDSISAINEFAETKEGEEAAAAATAGSGGGANGHTAADAAAAPGASSEEAVLGPDGQPVSETMAGMMAVDGTRARTAALRAQIELARLEMKEKDFPRAVEVLETALDTAKAKFGPETAEASSVMAALATCHRQAGALDTSAELFQQLYRLNEAQSEPEGAANQSGIMLARTLAELYKEAERDSDALVWAERTLDLMSKVAGVPRTHPALEQHINTVIELKQKTGDEAGAEELRREALKTKAKLVAAAQRAGAAGGRGGAAAAGGGSGRANGAAAAGGKAGSKAGAGGGKKGKGKK